MAKYLWYGIGVTSVLGAILVVAFLLNWNHYNKSLTFQSLTTQQLEALSEATNNDFIFQLTNEQLTVFTDSKQFVLLDKSVNPELRHLVGVSASTIRDYGIFFKTLSDQSTIVIFKLQKPSPYNQNQYAGFIFTTESILQITDSTVADEYQFNGIDSIFLSCEEPSLNEINKTLTFYSKDDCKNFWVGMSYTLNLSNTVPVEPVIDLSILEIEKRYINDDATVDQIYDATQSTVNGVVTGKLLLSYEGGVPNFRVAVLDRDAYELVVPLDTIAVTKRGTLFADRLGNYALYKFDFAITDNPNSIKYSAVEVDEGKLTNMSETLNQQLSELLFTAENGPVTYQLTFSKTTDGSTGLTAKGCIILPGQSVGSDCSEISAGQQFPIEITEAYVLESQKILILGSMESNFDVTATDLVTLEIDLENNQLQWYIPTFSFYGLEIGFPHDSLFTVR